MNINDWLISHSAISYNWIEKKLNITTGTLRKNKAIPEAHRQAISELLRQYGYEQEQTMNTAKPPEIKPNETKQNDIYIVIRSWPELNGRRATFINGDKWLKIS